MRPHAAGHDGLTKCEKHHVRRFPEKSAVAVRCQRQDRDRHRRDRRVRRARRASRWPAPAAMSCIAAGSAEALKKVAAECEKLGGQSRDRQHAAEFGGELRQHRCRRGEAIRRRRHPGLASGINKVSKIVDQPPEDFLEVMDVNVTQSWLMARAAGKQMLAAGARRQGHLHVVGARAAGPSGRLHRLLRVEIRGRRHHQGARLRIRRDRHHCQRASRRPFSARR